MVSLLSLPVASVWVCPLSLLIRMPLSSSANLPETHCPNVGILFYYECQPHFSTLYFSLEWSTSGGRDKNVAIGSNQVFLAHKLSTTSRQERFWWAPHLYGCPRRHVKVRTPCPGRAQSPLTASAESGWDEVGEHKGDLNSDQRGQRCLWRKATSELAFGS